jgi:hypothetical protein
MIWRALSDDLGRARSPAPSWSTKKAAWSPNLVARERKRKETGKKVGDRKSHTELWPEVVGEARRLRRARGKAGRLSYREISARLKVAGYCNERGQPFNPQSRSRHDRRTAAAAAPTSRYALIF